MIRLANTILVMGGDGYLGWSLALALANRTDSKVVIVDNLIKRDWEKSVGVASLIQLKGPEERISQYEKCFGKKNLSFERVDLRDYDAVFAVIREYRPSAIVNAAQQPSAPFSMMSPKNANVTFENNTQTNLNVLWAIGKINSDIKYIKLGSAGSYLSIDSDYIPKSKVDFSFSYQNQDRKVLNSWMPMQASDFYHQSKANAFLLSDLCSDLWGLKVITVHQSTIFGHTIPENMDDDKHCLMTRYNYDHIFGTVINRFVCQAVSGFPLTVYGDGAQKTGVISLNDAVNNFVQLLDKEVDAGTHTVEHNYTHKLSINDIATSLGTIVDVDIQCIDNPRIEKNTKLEKMFEEPEFNCNEINNIPDFVRELSNLVHFTGCYKENINKELIMPKVKWGN
jgi:UDP-sulfoquinovose synthase